VLALQCLGWLNLRGCVLKGRDLAGARLAGANLEGARLRGCYELRQEQVKEAKNWQVANYDPSFREALGLAVKADINEKNSS
jgi:uncharacterized protein YjbI with pentapeptide repeats